MRELSDDEVFGATKELSDADVFGAPTDPPAGGRTATPVPAKTSGFGAGALDSVLGIAGDLVGGVANIGERAGDWLERRVPLSGLTEQQLEQKQLKPLFDLADYIEAGRKNIGYQPSVDFQQVKAAPLNLLQTGTFVAEQTVNSLPHMVAAVLNPLGYTLSQDYNIASERAKNNGREGDVTLADMAKAAPAAAMQTYLEKWATGKILPGEVTGANAAARIAKQIAIQGGTEYVQEQGAYAGETLGTDKGYSAAEGNDRGMAGALTGAAMGATTQGAGEAVARIASKRAPGALFDGPPDSGAPQAAQQKTPGKPAPRAAQEFVGQHRQAAEKLAQETGIPAEFMLGQAAHESGWGKRDIKNADGSSSNNLFGIKAGRSWTGPTTDIVTTEYEGGVPRKMVQKFRAYASPEESFRDFARLILSNPRYKGVKDARTPQEYGQRLQAGGYATDPAYAEKIGRVINTAQSAMGKAVQADAPTNGQRGAAPGSATPQAWDAALASIENFAGAPQTAQQQDQQQDQQQAAPIRPALPDSPAPQGDAIQPLYEPADGATDPAADPAEQAAPAPQDQQQALPPAAPADQPVLQNRDRSSAASVAQMNSIAAQPDYGRLGFSRDFANGSPVVAGGSIPPAQLGRRDVAVASDGRRIPVQYAVVEAGDVTPSHDAGGSPIARYADTGALRAIAGNGRIAGMQAAWQRGTASQYAQELASDDMHGVSPDAIKGMRQPVLVRVMPQDQATADIGDVSNTASNLDLSPVEQAANDVRRVDLDALTFGQDGSVSQEAIRQFVRAMPQAEQGRLVDTNGQPSRQAVDRLHAAIFQRAYNNPGLVRLFAQAQDPEARLILSALAQVAPKMARLEGAGALDIREIVTQAAEIAVNARRKGETLASAAMQLDMTTDPDVAVVLGLFARNPRSNKAAIEALSRAADLAYTEATKPADDMFGEVPRASRAEVINQLKPADEAASTQDLENAARGRTAGQDAGRGLFDSPRPADPAGAEAGRSGQPQEQPAGAAADRSGTTGGLTQGFSRGAQGGWRRARDRALAVLRRDFAAPKTVSSRNGDEIIVSYAGLRHALQHGVPSLEQTLLALNVRAVIRAADVEGVSPDKHGRSDPKSTTTYRANVSIDGVSYRARIFVRNHTDGNRYYDHAILDTEKPVRATEERNADAAPASPFDGLELSLDQVEQLVNAGSGGLTVQAAQDVADRLKAGWPGAPEITVVGDMHDAAVPQAVRDRDADQRSQGAQGRPEGFWHGGRVYLVAGELGSEADAVRVLMHETLGHHGLRAVFGARFGKLLSDVATARPAEIAAKLKQYGLQDTPDNRLVSAEELLADLAQTRPEMNGVKRAVMLIRNWLRDNVPGLKMPLTDDMIIQRFILPARRFVESQRKGGAQGGVAFQRAYHGTPHRGIDRFSADKIGTGEGAQVYGWGLYFASRKEVADWYRKKLTVEEDFVDGQPMDVGDPRHLLARILADESGDPDAARETLQGMALPGGSRTVREAAQSALGMLSAGQRPKVETRRPDGQLYEVDIPEDSELLLWDKPLSEQPGRIDRAAQSVDLDVADAGPVETGEDFYRALSGQLGGDQAASEALAAVGIKGIKYLDGTSRAGGDGSYNYVIFDGADAEITQTFYSRSQPPGRNADDRPGPAKSANRDELGRIKFRPGEIALEKLNAIADPILKRFHMKGASPELRKQLRAMKADIETARRKAGRLAGDMQGLSQADRVMISDIVEKTLAPGVIPPDAALKIADGITRTMDAQTDELVRLGMLSRDSAERWRGRYLPRLYNRRTELGDDAPVLAAFKQGRPVGRGIGGGSLKGRGLFQDVDADTVANWIGMGYEVRDPYWKWEQGKLALAGPNMGPIQQSKVTVWRDWTASERAQMGEYRDALYRFAQGYTSMQADIALGRLFENISKNPEWVRRSGSDGFAQVPTTEIPGSGGVKRYGHLAGLWVKQEVLDHIDQHAEEVSDAKRLWREAVGLWKEGKTALNPVAHFNNIMGNLSMAHFAGVSLWDGHKYVGAVRDLIKKGPMLGEATDAGLFTGSFGASELADALPPELRALVQQDDGAARRTGRRAMDMMTLFLRQPMRNAYEAEDAFFKFLLYRDARERGLSPQDATDHALRYIFAYDDLPKGARAVRDYAIPFFAWTYKAVPALLHTALVYPWRLAMPAVVLNGTNAVSYIMAAGDDDDDWMTAWLKGRELEKTERAVLPDRSSGLSMLGSPKTIRLGTDRLTGNPVFLDASRIIPGGDMFDMENQAGGIDLPAPIMPSHPVLSVFSAMIANRELFMGRDVADKNDTTAEGVEKRAKWMAGLLLPAIAPGGYHSQRILDAIANMTGKVIETPLGDFTGIDRSGQPVQPGYAAMQTLGIKARPVDLDLEAQRRAIAKGSTIKSIEAEVRSSARNHQRGAMTDAAFERDREAARAKIERIRDGEEQ